MKKIFDTVVILVILVFSVQAYADLYNRGTDSLGNRLIYDSDLDITWYDYTNAYDGVGYQKTWASLLTVNFGGTIFDDWRLPSTVDGYYDFGYDGTTTAGYNISTSELGHLFYTELGNSGQYDTSGNLIGCSYSCLTKTGPFLNLEQSEYWSGTDYGAEPGYTWYFSFGDGVQSAYYNDDWYLKSAIAVRAGDVVILPEPISFILFLTGGTLFTGRNCLRKRGSRKRGRAKVKKHGITV